jgi:hypothetical protein
VLLLDFHLRSLEHCKQLRKGLSHPLHVVIQDKSLIGRGNDCSTLSIASLFRIWHSRAFKH